MLNMVGLSDFPGCRSSCLFSSHKNTEHQILTVEAAQSWANFGQYIRSFVHGDALLRAMRCSRQMLHANLVQSPGAGWALPVPVLQNAPKKCQGYCTCFYQESNTCQALSNNLKHPHQLLVRSSPLSPSMTVARQKPLFQYVLMKDTYLPEIQTWQIQPIKLRWVPVQIHFSIQSDHHPNILPLKNRNEIPQFPFEGRRMQVVANSISIFF